MITAQERYLVRRLHLRGVFREDVLRHDIIFSPGYKYIVISNVTVQSSCSDLPFPFSAAVLDVFRNLRPPAEK
jgi:hypothetical protein